MKFIHGWSSAFHDRVDGVVVSCAISVQAPTRETAIRKMALLGYEVVNKDLVYETVTIECRGGIKEQRLLDERLAVKRGGA